MTLEESKEEFLKELNRTNQLILEAYKSAVERLNKETQELQEQNAELVEMLEELLKELRFHGFNYSTAICKAESLIAKNK